MGCGTDAASTTAVACAREMIDLGVVFKAQTVIETVESLLGARGIDLSAVAPKV